MIHVLDTTPMPGGPYYVNDHSLVQARDGSCLHRHAAWHAPAHTPTARRRLSSTGTRATRRANAHPCPTNAEGTLRGQPPGNPRTKATRDALPTTRLASFDALRWTTRGFLFTPGLVAVACDSESDSTFDAEPPRPDAQNGPINNLGPGGGGLPDAAAEGRPTSPRSRVFLEDATATAVERAKRLVRPLFKTRARSAKAARIAYYGLSKHDVLPRLELIQRLGGKRVRTTFYSENLLEMTMA